MRSAQRFNIFLWVTPVVVIALVASLPSPAGELGTDDQPSEFTETIEVRVAELEVYVTDKEGLPVRGLGRDDFRLFIDGRPAGTGI